LELSSMPYIPCGKTGYLIPKLDMVFSTTAQILFATYKIINPREGNNERIYYSTPNPNSRNLSLSLDETWPTYFYNLSLAQVDQ